MQSLLYPIFLPFVLWGSLFPFWILFSATPPSNIFGAVAVGIIVVLWGAVLQLLLGIPSLFLLRRWRSLRAHLALGGALGCAVSVANAATTNEEGESVFKAALAGVVLLPPFLAGYGRLYYLRVRKLQLQSEATPTSQ
jgi:hypothetical protein